MPMIKDEFGSLFKVEDGVTYDLLRKEGKTNFIKNEEYRQGRGLHKTRMRKMKEVIYLSRIIKKDGKGRLYIQYGPQHLYCLEETAFQENDKVFIDSNFYCSGIFGVSKDKQNFETWRTKAR